MIDKLKIAIVCDWLTVYAGAERVIFEMHELFPKAPIYTSIYNPLACKVFSKADVRESWLKNIPFAKFAHRLFLPFMPRIFESMDLSEYDIVLSSNHSVSKGIITKPETLHISYCHSPVRYLWDRSHSYTKEFKKFSFLRYLYKPYLRKLRLWDRLAVERVDYFLANSKYVQARIKKYYGRESELIYPPVDLSRFKVTKEKENYYLAIGRLIPYKKFDLILKACIELKKPLKIVGMGPDFKRLKKIAGSHKNIEFLGQITDPELSLMYSNAKALIFPQVEDFGIVPLEAMASGTPVIAYAKGGALETVKEGESGLFFNEQSVESIKSAIKKFEKTDWDANKIADSVKEFSSARFKSELRHEMEKAWKNHLKMLGSEYEEKN